MKRDKIKAILAQLYGPLGRNHDQLRDEMLTSLGNLPVATPQTIRIQQRRIPMIKRIAKIAAAIVIVAACLMAGVFLWQALGPIDRAVPGGTQNTSLSKTEPPDSTGDRVDSVCAARWPSIEERVGQADLIIRGVLESTGETPTHWTCRYRVIKLLKGRANGNVVTVHSGKGHPGEEGDNKERVGKESILFLGRFPGKDTLYVSLGETVSELDERTAEILDAVNWTFEPALDSLVEVNAQIERDGNRVLTGTGDTVPILATWCMELNYFRWQQVDAKETGFESPLPKGDHRQFFLSLRFKTPRLGALRIGLALYDSEGKLLTEAKHLEPLEPKADGKSTGVVREYWTGGWGAGRLIGLDLPKGSDRASRIRLTFKPVLAKPD